MQGGQWNGRDGANGFFFVVLLHCFVTEDESTLPVRVMMGLPRSDSFSAALAPEMWNGRARGRMEAEGEMGKEGRRRRVRRCRRVEVKGLAGDMVAWIWGWMNGLVID